MADYLSPVPADAVATFWCQRARPRVHPALESAPVGLSYRSGHVGDPYTDRLERGVALFNDGSFFEAHDVWEDAWRESEGDVRLFLQGLIQIAAGFVKLQRG